MLFRAFHISFSQRSRPLQEPISGPGGFRGWISAGCLKGQDRQAFRRDRHPLSAGKRGGGETGAALKRQIQVSVFPPARKSTPNRRRIGIRMDGFGCFMAIWKGLTEPASTFR
jgi:hypothetical protein